MAKSFEEFANRVMSPKSRARAARRTKELVQERRPFFPNGGLH